MGSVQALHILSDHLCYEDTVDARDHVNGAPTPHTDVLNIIVLTFKQSLGRLEMHLSILTQLVYTSIASHKGNKACRGLELLSQAKVQHYN